MAPTSSSFIRGLRRMSTPSIRRRSSQVNTIENISNATQSHIGVQSKSKRLSESGPEISILALPTELITQIVQWLSFQDLCALRRTCHDADSLIFEGDAIRRWITVSISGAQLALYPAPSPATFTYAREQQRRRKIADDLSTQYSNYVEHEILRYTLRRQDPTLGDKELHESFQPVWFHIRHEMVTSLLVIQHYFEKLAESTLELCVGEDPFHFQVLYDELWARERCIFEDYDSNTLLRAHKCFLFLSWINGQSLKRPSYVGTVEHAMRGWFTTEPLQVYDFQLLLVFGNLKALAQLTGLKTFKDRRKAVEASIRQLDPKDNVHWERCWSAMSMTSGRSLTIKQAERALQLKLPDGAIWVKGARAALTEKGLLDAEDVDIGSPQQCMDYLTEIAGYDILHQSPSMAPVQQYEEC